MMKELLQIGTVIADGAMGTYYSQTSGESAGRVELANIDNPQMIRDIHREYIDAGARIIRSNTFAANTISLQCSMDRIREIVRAAWDNLLSVCNETDLIPVANIGPIPELDFKGETVSLDYIYSEYITIIDILISAGATVFNFETFSSLDHLDKLFLYIRKHIEDSYIMVNFSVGKDGYTRSGLNIDELRVAAKSLDADLCGLNCGAGPTHLKKYIDGFDTIYPNAGYPEVVESRTIYNSSPTYFGESLIELKEGRVKIIGGCCGTTPEHIRALVLLMSEEKRERPVREVTTYHYKRQHKSNKRHIIAVELDPPSKPDLTKLINSGKKLLSLDIDMITVADSPSGRMRLNPIMTALRIKRELGVRVMPHICCRDRNLIALKSDILTAYSEGIEDILFITGDPVPMEERDVVKKVFNCNSVTLMQQVKDFNKELLGEKPFNIGGALNVNARNWGVEESKYHKKRDAGATTFLTQPVYDERAIERIESLKKEEGIKILAGILPLVNYRNARFLDNEFPGISIPQEVIERFHPDMTREEASDVGVEISLEIIDRLRDIVDGFYFMTPFGRTSLITDIIRKSELV